MAVLKLTTRNDIGDFRYQVALDGELFQFRYIYNRREDFWYLDVLDSEGVPIRMGLKLVVSWPIMVRLADPRGWAGGLVLIDTTSQDLEAVLEDLGERVSVLYEEAAA